MECLPSEKSFHYLESGAGAARVSSRLVAARAAMTHRVQGFVPYKGMKSEQPGL